MLINHLHYAAIILKQFFDDMSMPYLILMEPDAVYSLANTREEILSEEKMSWYLQTIWKRMHLCHTSPDLIFLVNKLAYFLSKSYVIHESTLHRMFGYIKYTISFSA